MNHFSTIWDVKTLEELAANVPNAIVDGPFGSNLKTSDYMESGVPVLQGKNITNNSFRWFDIRYVSEAKADELKRSSVQVNDILLVKIGSIGYAACIDSLEGHERAIIPANLAKITPDNGIVDNRYLYRWITSPTAKNYFQSVASKTAQPALSLGKIKALKVPVPPLFEQRRIAAILDQADALRAKRREALAQLDSLTQSIFIEMFGEPTANSKGLEKVPIGDLVKLKSGDFLPASEMTNDGEIPVLGGNGINGYHDQFMFKEPKIVIGRVGVYCGCVHVSPSKSWITDNALYISQHSSRVSFSYLAFALKHADLNQYASQSAQPLISGARLYPVEILVPPMAQQVEFAARSTAVNALKATHNTALQELDKLFASLQHRAFQGEL